MIAAHGELIKGKLRLRHHFHVVLVSAFAGAAASLGKLQEVLLHNGQNRFGITPAILAVTNALGIWADNAKSAFRALISALCHFSLKFSRGEPTL